MERQRNKRTATLLVLGCLAVLTVISAPFIGMKIIPLSAVFGGSAGGGVDSEIFWRLRLPRVGVSFVSGAVLAVAGMAFQAMFRNPLATPFTLGVASGASLGAVLYIRMGLALTLLGVPGVTVAAMIGALAAVMLVYFLTTGRRMLSGSAMLLAGVAVTFFFSSLILFIQYLSDFTNSFRILRWLMGGLGVVGYDAFFNLLPFAVIGCAVVFFLTRELNLLTTGEDMAASRGVDVRRTGKILFFATSLMVAGVVAVCGPIGFVGMMAPHICRLIIGPEHRFLAPASFLFGGMFLTLCDGLARTLMAPAEMPVGIITALLGGPFFFWLLVRGKPAEI